MLENIIEHVQPYNQPCTEPYRSRSIYGPGQTSLKKQFMSKRKYYLKLQIQIIHCIARGRRRLDALALIFLFLDPPFRGVIYGHRRCDGVTIEPYIFSLSDEGPQLRFSSYYYLEKACHNGWRVTAAITKFLVVFVEEEEEVLLFGP